LLDKELEKNKEIPSQNSVNLKEKEKEKEKKELKPISKYKIDMNCIVGFSSFNGIFVVLTETNEYWIINYTNGEKDGALKSKWMMI
jgi:hypothetical protein